MFIISKKMKYLMPNNEILLLGLDVNVGFHSLTDTVYNEKIF